MKSKTLVLVQEMKILALEIHSDDGVANAVIQEAAERLEELFVENGELRVKLNNCLIKEFEASERGKAVSVVQENNNGDVHGRKRNER